jgi:hypothetical protein
MGVLQIANLLPQVIVPIIAAATINSFHNYSVLFVVVAIAAVLGGVLIAPIKGVR